jgi:pimeloyl-ACP methyl ester carboxylesterase
MGGRDARGGFSGFSRGGVALDDAWLSWLERPGRGAPLVLVPGSFDDARAFEGVAAGLDPALRIVIVEMRGHGGSWPPPRDGSIELFARDVLRAAAALGLDCFFVGGHSIGGMVALEVASSRPASVRGVISIEGWTSARALEDAFGGDVTGTLTPQGLARRDELRRPVMERWSAGQVEDFRAIWRRWDGSRFLAETRLPVLEIYGDRGRPRPGRARLGLPERENIELRWIAGASHCLPIEAPGEVARAIMSFLGRVEGRS